MKKLLLAIILVIPVMGYCGFIDWIQGYPEVKAEIQQGLEKMYHGDKFEVWDVTYSDNLGGYNFKAKDTTRDITNAGSYFPKTKTLWANGFMWSVVSAQWRNMFNPYVEKVSDNYLITGGVGTQDSVDYKKYKKDFRKNALHDLFSMKDVQVKKWLDKDHNVIKADISVFVAVPKTAVGIYKTVKMIEEFNNKLRSLHLYSYRFRVITYSVPKRFSIAKYFDEVSLNFHTNLDWWFVEGIQKYAWGYFDVRSCMPTDVFVKYCNTYKDLNNPEKLDVELIKKYTLADRLNSIQDIITQFRLVDNVGVPGKCGVGPGGCSVMWGVNARAHKQLKDSQYYSKLEQLVNQGS